MNSQFYLTMFIIFHYIPIEETEHGIIIDLSRYENFELFML